MKAYAEDRLVDAGEAETVRGRHFDHFQHVATVHGRIIESEYHLCVRWFRIARTSRRRSNGLPQLATGCAGVS